MSLKRHDRAALILILVAAIFWTMGRYALDQGSEHAVFETTATQETTYPATAPTGEGWTQPSPSGTTPLSPGSETEGAGGSRSIRALGYTLSFAAVLIAGAAALFFPQKVPVCGPDGVCMLLALLVTVYDISQNMDYILWTSTVAMLTAAYRLVSSFIVMFGVRELYGWIRAKFSLSWCLAGRIARRGRTPQVSLLALAGWIVLSLAGTVYSLAAPLFISPFPGYLAAACFGVRCLWQYGADLAHFQEQLKNYQEGRPIAVGSGAFAQTEAQLLEVHAQHEEAVRAAVTSERFKVELISNVSHDLRTPLTSILGYSELLLKEELSPQGKEQLRRLHEKAGYMNDLVGSLFELTKVSSGVLESRMEKLDLVRLLEQTIGLFDDQLAAAGLTVRRSYCAGAISVVTDGARMHQVFANLLGNAIKYAMAGTRIYLEVQETDERYRIRMVNTASYEMDFDPKEITQRFARGDKARSTKGSGLGLAIAQTYTGSVGGDFWVAVDGDQFSAIVELPKTERDL